MSSFGTIGTTPTERHFNNHSLCIQDHASVTVRSTAVRAWRGFWHHFLWPKHRFVTTLWCQNSAAEIAENPAAAGSPLSGACSAATNGRPQPLSLDPRPETALEGDLTAEHPSGGADPDATWLRTHHADLAELVRRAPEGS